MCRSDLKSGNAAGAAYPCPFVFRMRRAFPRFRRRPCGTRPVNRLSSFSGPAIRDVPLAVTLVDSRPETLNGLPESVCCEAVAMPEALVETAPPLSGFVVMTHDHGLDFLITAAALARGDAAYVGMIGSATKRARFASHLRDLGRPSDIHRLTLPIGASALRDKRPEVIAALTASELLTCLLSAQQKSLPLRLA